MEPGPQRRFHLQTESTHSVSTQRACFDRGSLELTEQCWHCHGETLVPLSALALTSQSWAMTSPLGISMKGGPQPPLLLPPRAVEGLEKPGHGNDFPAMIGQITAPRVFNPIPQNGEFFPFHGKRDFTEAIN